MATCGQCRLREAGSDGLCRPCRAGRARRKYAWTEELLAELRRAYQMPKAERAAAVDRIARRTGWPRKAILLQAVRMGITTWHRKRWTAEEDEQLQEWVGRVTWPTIARRLGRSVAACQSRSDHVLKLSRRPTEGYTLLMLQTNFGASNGLVRSWVRRGLFGNLRMDRVTEAAVERFIRQHPHEYDLRRVDETWFKALLFGRHGAAMEG